MLNEKAERKSVGLDYNSSQTKEEDTPGREKGSKGGWSGAFGHLPEMHFRQAMQAADTQDPAGPLSPPAHRQHRKA